jgi:hypothetical protein
VGSPWSDFPAHQHVQTPTKLAVERFARPPARSNADQARLRFFERASSSVGLGVEVTLPGTASSQLLGGFISFIRVISLPVSDRVPLERNRQAAKVYRSRSVSA